MTNATYNIANMQSHFPNVNKLINDKNLTKTVLKIATIVPLVFALLKDLIYNVSIYLGTKSMDEEPSILPTEENIDVIRSLLLKYTPMIFAGKACPRQRLHTHNKNVQEHSTRLGGVFSLSEIPHLIFKRDVILMIRGKEKLQDTAKRINVDLRNDNIIFANRVIADNNFQYLKIPQTVKFEIIPENSKQRKYKVLAQEKLSPVMDNKKPKAIRDVVLHDKAVEELILFILKTGYYDVDDRNLLVLQKGDKYQIGIIDFEHIDLSKLKIALHGSQTIAGLFNVLPGKKALIEEILRSENKEDLIEG